MWFLNKIKGEKKNKCIRIEFDKNMGIRGYCNFIIVILVFDFGIW